MARRKSTAKSPAFQFYPKDFLTDERQLALSTTGAGIYIRLLCHCWLSESLPNEPVILAKMAASDLDTFMTEWGQISACFVDGKNGRIVHQRLLHEKDKQDKFRKLQQQKGLRSGAVRSKSVQPNVNRGSTVVEPRPVEPNGNSSISDLLSSSSSPSPERTNTKKEQIHSALKSALDGFDAFWIAFPRKVAKGAAVKAWIKLKPTVEVQAQIVAALMWQANQDDWQRDGGQYVPHPATWLNRCQWQDEQPKSAAYVGDAGRQTYANGRLALARIQES